MVKVIAGILLFFGCTALGFSKASGYKNRRVELEDTLELIRLLHLVSKGCAGKNFSTSCLTEILLVCRCFARMRRRTDSPKDAGKNLAGCFV